VAVEGLSSASYQREALKPSVTTNHLVVMSASRALKRALASANARYSFSDLCSVRSKYTQKREVWRATNNRMVKREKVTGVRQDVRDRDCPRDLVESGFQETSSYGGDHTPFDFGIRAELHSKGTIIMNWKCITRGFAPH